MGSGYIMTAAVLKALQNLSPDKQKEALESLGVVFLVDTFGDGGFEDFETKSKRGADLVCEAVKREFGDRFGKDYPFSVDVRRVGTSFKVSFFK